MAESQNISELVTAVFHAWKAVGVDFLILRNYESLPDFTGNDIDVLVNPNQLSLAEKELIASARSVGFILHNRAEFSPVSLFFYHLKTNHQIQFDLFGMLRWRGLTLLSTERVLAQKIQREIFSIPHPAHEAVLNLITRLLYQKYVKETYRPKIQATFQLEKFDATAVLIKIFGKSLGETIFDEAISGNWKSIESRASRIRRVFVLRELFRHPARSFRGVASDFFRLSRRFLRPPGIAVVLLGPDGCGKSSLAVKMIEGLRHSFSPDKGIQVHWKPVVFSAKRRRDRPPTTNPHAQPPRNQLYSLIFLGYHWLEFFLGYWFQMRPVRFKNGLVMIDRYYYDFLIDPKRYRLNAPRFAVRLGQIFLPKPDLIFLLDAAPEVLQSRKQEVPFEETARQRRAFLELVPLLSNAQIIDGAQSLDDIATVAIRTTLEFSARSLSAKGEYD